MLCTRYCFVQNYVLSRYFKTVIQVKIYVLCCAIWYHLYNFKNVRNTHGRVLLLVNFIKSNTPHGCFLNCTNCTWYHTNGTKSCNTPHILIRDSIQKATNQETSCSTSTIKVPSSPPTMENFQICVHL